jgi:carbonic anhydrase
MKNSGAVISFVFLMAGGTALASSDGPEWSYEGDRGPEHWGDLAPEFIQCKVGLNQSPVDLANTLDADLPPLKLNYTTNTTTIVNNGHTAQAGVEPGNTLVVGGETFELLQFHLHTPSEHSINGKQFAMETHYVHRNDKGELAVVGVLHDIGPASAHLKEFETQIPAEFDQPAPFVTPRP